MTLFQSQNEGETIRFAQQLASCISDDVVIYLQGDLGAGKTTLARGFIQFFGFDKVKSPTYSLVESYQNSQISIHHFDCYRLSNPEELDYIGIREYSGIQLIEWAQHGLGMIKPADMIININGIEQSRTLKITVLSKLGEQLLSRIQKLM